MTRAPFTLLLAVFFGSIYFFQSGQHNETARWGQIRSIVENGSLTLEGSGVRTADVISIDGKLYSNKAPGFTFFAASFWSPAKLVGAKLGFTGNNLLHLTCWIVNGLTVGLSSVLITLLIWKLAFRILLSYSAASLVAWCVSFGTILYPFSTLFFSHTFTALLGLGSLACIVFIKDRCRDLAFLFCGIFLGFGIASEYPAVITAVVIGLYALTKANSRWQIILLFSGGFLALCPLFYYNAAIFSDPLKLSYTAYTSRKDSMFPAHKMGFLGVSLPQASVFYEITFGAQRGLFRCNPWLLLCVPGFMLGMKERQNREIYLVSAAIVLFFLLFNSSYGDGLTYWGGGAAIGPRHIIPSLPFMAILCFPVLRYKSGQNILLILGSLSFCFMLGATVVEPRFGYDAWYPITEIIYGLYKDGVVQAEYSGIFSDQAFLNEKVAVSLGELIGLPKWTVGIPVGLAAALALFASTKNNRFSGYISLGGIAFWSLLPAFSHVAWEMKFPEPKGLEYFSGASLSIIGEKPFESTAELESLYKKNDGEAVVHPEIAFGSGVISKEKGTALWTGRILVSDSKRYNFATVSDDGSALYIDDKLVVSNWGIHGMKREEGSVELTPGFHKLDIHYYNSGGESGMVLLWGAPGMPWHPVPAKRLFLSQVR